MVFDCRTHCGRYAQARDGEAGVFADEVCDVPASRVYQKCHKNQQAFTTNLQVAKLRDKLKLRGAGVKA